MRARRLSVPCGSLARLIAGWLLLATGQWAVMVAFGDDAIAAFLGSLVLDNVASVPTPRNDRHIRPSPRCITSVIQFADKR